MLKDIHSIPTEEALRMLGDAPEVELAGTAEDGSPILRTLHGVLHDGALCFHGAPVGEKSSLLGRTVVIGFSRTLARIPSYFRDPERACPATTYFESVQVTGLAEPISDRTEKAQALEALMHHLQPEGGYVPIEAEHPLYRGALDKLSVFRVRPRRVVGKRKLGQERSVEDIERMTRRLWQRGAPGDLRGIERILDAHPARPVPKFLRAPGRLRLVTQAGDADVAAVVDLLRGQYWNERFDDRDIAEAHRGSVAWMVARDDAGCVWATARASSDGGKRAEIFDVAVHPARRGLGLGRTLLSAMLDHPGVRQARFVHLSTKDAQDFYASHGFRAIHPRHTRMELARSARPENDAFERTTSSV